MRQFWRVCARIKNVIDKKHAKKGRNDSWACLSPHPHHMWLQGNTQKKPRSQLLELRRPTHVLIYISEQQKAMKTRWCADVRSLSPQYSETSILTIQAHHKLRTPHSTRASRYDTDLPGSAPTSFWSAWVEDPGATGAPNRFHVYTCTCMCCDPNYCN